MHILPVPPAMLGCSIGLSDDWTQVAAFSWSDQAGSNGKTIDIDELFEGLVLWADKTTRRFAVWSDTVLCDDTKIHIVNDFVRPKLLALDGYLVMHGGLSGSIAGGIGFIGESGQGKSTLTASLHGSGMPLISDDTFAVQAGHGTHRARRVYPSLRLFPDSLEWLFPDAQMTTAVAENTNKRRVPFYAGPPDAPLQALFVLSKPAEDICAVRLTQADACMKIIANSFAFDRNDPVEARTRLGKAAELARTVPVFDLRYPRDYAALKAVHCCILNALNLTPPDKAST